MKTNLLRKNIQCMLQTNPSTEEVAMRSLEDLFQDEDLLLRWADGEASAEERRKILDGFGRSPQNILLVSKLIHSGLLELPEDRVAKTGFIGRLPWRFPKRLAYGVMGVAVLLLVVACLILLYTSNPRRMPGDGSNSPSIAAIPAPPDHVKMRGANDPDLNHLKDRRTFCLLKRDAQGNEGFLSQSELPPGMKKQLQEAKLSLLQDRKKATFVLIFSEDGKILEIIHGDSKHRLEIDDDIDRQLENILAR